MMNYHYKTAVIFICIGLCNTLFVPEQLPTLLSFIYTNIPPVRKGTDSRIGLGFRLGPNADFQVLFELGPQQNTLPIGPAGSNSNTNKRETQVPVKNPNWLQLWKQQSDGPFMNPADGSDSNNVSMMDEDVINHLKQLYKEQQSDISSNKTETPPNDVKELS